MKHVKKYEVQGPKMMQHTNHTGEVVAEGEFWAVAEVGHNSPDWAYSWSYREAVMACEEANRETPEGA